MGFGLHSAGVTVVTAAAATGGGDGGGGGAAAAAIVRKILLHNFMKYFEYKSRLRPVAMFVSTELANSITYTIGNYVNFPGFSASSFTIT
jgi:hypothetical protein